jgi:hypothetical protein
VIISHQTQRRYILGKQGLWPGRRWRGKAGVVEASRSGAVIQIDPISVVARSHDTSLYGRVLDYSPDLLDQAMHSDRALFDWGGTVGVYPMHELPYFRVAMARKVQNPRWLNFAKDYADVIAHVLGAIRDKGPHGSRDFDPADRKATRWRSGKATSQAMYYLWLGGELMSHSRRNFERIYDLRERVAPPEVHHAASAEEAEAYFMLDPFHELGLVTVKGWRASYMGVVERKVDPAEASARLESLLADGRIAQLMLEGDPKTPRYVLAEDLPLIETLASGGVPAGWSPLETTTEQEMTILAPLEIVSARGRAAELFDFEYVWEVYKPAEKRRWGYYVMPSCMATGSWRASTPSWSVIRARWSSSASGSKTASGPTSSSQRRWRQACGATAPSPARSESTWCQWSLQASVIV